MRKKTREQFLRLLHKQLYPVALEKTLAAWTFALSTKPSVSTKTWRFVPFISSACPRRSRVPLHPRAGALHRLRIDYPGGGLRVASDAHAQTLSDGGRVELLPSAVDAPEAKVVVDGLPGREEVVGQQAPSASATENVEEDGALRTSRSRA